jgi:hypothetical protein
MACLPSLTQISKVEIGHFLEKLNAGKPVLEIAPQLEDRLDKFEISW